MNVNKSDLFLYVFDELIAPESKMFMYNESKTLMWFPPKVQPAQIKLCDNFLPILILWTCTLLNVVKLQLSVEAKRYFLFGVLCGLALYNHNIIHLPFSPVLFKKLLRVKPTLDDMKEFEPVIGE